MEMEPLAHGGLQHEADSDRELCEDKLGMTEREVESKRQLEEGCMDETGMWDHQQ